MNGKVLIERPTPQQGEQQVSAVFDRERLRQALSILLDNAVKYTPEGGRVAMKIGEEDGSVGVEVADTRNRDTRGPDPTRLRALLPRRGSPVDRGPGIGAVDRPADSRGSQG